MDVRDRRRTNWFWIDKEIWHNEELNSSDRIVYSTLAYYANSETQECYPSVETLIKFSKLSERTIQSSISHLEDLKYITVRREMGKVNVYTLLEIPTPAKFAPPQINRRYPRKITGRTIIILTRYT